MGCKILALLTSMLLTGCFSPYNNAIPENYSGSVSNIKDTMLFHNNGKSDFFYVSHINNKRILDSRAKSIASPQPYGIKMYAQTINRDVPSEELNLTIVGRTGYAAPILAMTGKEYRTCSIKC
ncbi:MAG: hypothetical protein OQK46_02295 [Gammaproteobacteria bacterium]|nr:hypothetical protein [Gammaproteobacteria bacterium]